MFKVSSLHCRSNCKPQDPLLLFYFLLSLRRFLARAWGGIGGGGDTFRINALHTLVFPKVRAAAIVLEYWQRYFVAHTSWPQHRSNPSDSLLSPANTLGARCRFFFFFN